MATQDPPTMMTRWSHPYTAPAAWDRGTLCQCNNCPDCTRWSILIAPITLTVDDAGECYQAGTGAAQMPLISTLTTEFCISFKNTSEGVYTVYSQDTAKFIIDGESWDVARVTGEACFCFNGKDFVVTGDVYGGSLT